MTVEQNFFIYQLKQAKGIGNVGMLKILKIMIEQDWPQCSVTRLAEYAELNAHHRALFIQSYQEVLRKKNQYYQSFCSGHFFSLLDDCYPNYLREIYNPPIALFYKGSLELLNNKSLAMIGSRRATKYGEDLLEKLIPELVKAGFTIVSGLAKGIDTRAHQVTIRAQGKTIAVIGSGLDIPYPKTNFRLQEYLGDHHLLLSEYPEGTPPLPYHFPARNRIIAGLAQGTCVVEAREKSGTMITAQIALESGREVFAIPGSILEGQSDGCHRLVQQGAKCVWNSQHIIEEMRFFE